MHKVVVLGSLNMDLSIACERIPKNGETLNGYGFFMSAGGKGGNQAVACAKCKTLTYMIAHIGNDVFGAQLKDTLRKQAINVHYVQEVMQNTGIAMIVRHDQDNRILLENGANHTLHNEYLKAVLDHIGNAQDIFLTQLENNFSAVAYGLHYAKEKGMYTIFNPAPAISLPKVLYEDVDVIIVNQSECELLTGIYPHDVESVEQAIQSFQALGCDVILTLGKQGSVAYIAHHKYEVRAYHVETLDTTGAGDTYVGVFCAMLAQQESIAMALKYANAASALAVQKEGAQSSIPKRKEIEAFMKRQMDKEQNE